MARLIGGLKGQVGQTASSRDVQSVTGLWGFLRDKRHQRALGRLGGGLIVVAAGLWAAFVYFHAPVKSPEAKSPEPTPPSVQADRGGIAIGGNVTGATITTSGPTNSGAPAQQK